MRIIHNNKNDKPEKSLGEVRKSLNEIQDLINNHWSDPENEIDGSKKASSLVKKIWDATFNRKKRNKQFVFASIHENNEV